MHNSYYEISDYEINFMLEFVCEMRRDLKRFLD